MGRCGRSFAGDLPTELHHYLVALRCCSAQARPITVSFGYSPKIAAVIRELGQNPAGKKTPSAGRQALYEEVVRG